MFIFHHGLRQYVHLRPQYIGSDRKPLLLKKIKKQRYVNLGVWGGIFYVHIFRSLLQERRYGENRSTQGLLYNVNAKNELKKSVYSILQCNLYIPATNV
jgi:hypothetical protein